MKKILAVVLILSMVLSCTAAFAAERLEGIYTGDPIAEGQYPVDGNVKLKYWMPINKSAVTFISNYDENPAYALMQEVTGVDVEFIHPAVGQAKEDFQLLTLGGNLPDIIQIDDASWYEGGVEQMYEDGLIIDLTPYLEEYAPQYLKVINDNEDVARQVYRGEDGQVFGFYKVSYGDALPWCRIDIRKDWLDEAGMTEPMTIAEYEAWFDWILANKPGVTPFFMDFSSADQLNNVMGAFDLLPTWYVGEDGNVHYYANEAAFKDFLTLMSEWYAKGYISRDFVSLTGTEADALFDSDRLACYCGSNNCYARTLNLDMEISVAPYLRKEADSKLHNQISDNPVGGYISVVTTACKNPEAAIAMLNYAYTFEGSITYNWGIEGLTYEWGEDGFPHYTEYVSNNPDGKTTGNISYCDRIHLGSKLTWGDNICGPGMTTNPGQKAWREMWLDDENVDNAYRLPPITLTADETSDRNDIMSQIDSIVSETMLKMITGVEPLDNFDAFVEKINTYGMNDAIAITQGAYDRYMGK